MIFECVANDKLKKYRNFMVNFCVKDKFAWNHHFQKHPLEMFCEKSFFSEIS